MTAEIDFRCRWYWRKLTTGVADTGGKLTTGVADTGGNLTKGVPDTIGKLTTGVPDTGGKLTSDQQCQQYQIAYTEI